MSNYEQLMSLLNKKTETTDTKSVMQRITDVTKDAYANAVVSVGGVVEAVELNIMATPKLFEAGRAQVRDEIAGRLAAIITGK